MTAGVNQLDQLSPSLGERLAVFPFALTNAILPPLPITIDIISVIKTPYSFQFSFENQQSWLNFIVVIALLGWAALALRWQNRATRYLFGTAATIIAFNWTLHLFFGEELFVYSQHWLMAMLIMLAGLLQPNPTFGTTGRWSLLVLVLLAAWNDVQILDRVMSRLTETVTVSGL